MWRWKGNNSGHNHVSTSVIDQGCEVDGRFAFVGTLVVNGKFRGEVVSSDTLLVGEKGELEADVQVGVAIISGQIRGNITAREKVELRAAARVFGDIISPVLVLAEGVVFDGHCKMRSEEPEAVRKSS